MSEEKRSQSFELIWQELVELAVKCAGKDDLAWHGYRFYAESKLGPFVRDINECRFAIANILREADESKRKMREDEKKPNMAECMHCKTLVLQQDLTQSGQCINIFTCAKVRRASEDYRQKQYARLALTSEEVGNLMFLCGYAIAKAQTDKQMPEGAAYRMARFVESIRRGMHGLGDDE